MQFLDRISRKDKLIGVAILALGALNAAISGDFSKKPEVKEVPVARARSGPSPLLLEIQAKDEVRKRLRDPSSAEFSSLSVRGDVVCGFVNSKNGFGGMSGPKPFISRPGVLTALDDDAQEGIAETWRKVCA